MGPINNTEAQTPAIGASGLCRLCLQNPPIENSHIIPKFVFRALKSDSPTGFIRNPDSPNRREQDGTRVRLICNDCERRFSEAERKVAAEVFLPFHEKDQDRFTYGPWLHYFMTSLAWRTLILDLPGLEVDLANPRAAVADLTAAAEMMRKYLLGTDGLAGLLRNHVCAFTGGHTGSSELAEIGPNVMLRRSIFGYTVLNRDTRHSGILHNLAGFMCFFIVKGNPRDTWSHTKVHPAGGEIKQPQRVSSWLMGELLNCLVDSKKKLATVSEVQRKRVSDAVSANPTAPAMRFWERDRIYRGDR